MPDSLDGSYGGGGGGNPYYSGGGQGYRPQGYGYGAGSQTPWWQQQQQPPDWQDYQKWKATQGQQTSGAQGSQPTGTVAQGGTPVGGGTPSPADTSKQFNVQGGQASGSTGSQWNPEKESYDSWLAKQNKTAVPAPTPGPTYGGPQGSIGGGGTPVPPGGGAVQTGQDLMKREKSYAPIIPTGGGVASPWANKERRPSPFGTSELY